MKRYKKEADGKLEIGLVMYTKHYKLSVDRAQCKGCQLCRIACPKQLVSRAPREDIDGKAVSPLVDVDEAKCDYCGICALACPFSAIRININGDEKPPVLAYGVYPAYERDLQVDNALCKPECKLCEEACGLGVLSVNTEIGEVACKTELCAGCTACWMECPEEAVTATKFIEGSIDIDTGKCPEGCRRCVDVCPVNGVAYEDGEVFANDYTCIYCGACLEVCPAEGAISIERTAIRHSQVDSAAWNKSLAKLTSEAGLQRELAAANAAKAAKNLEVDA
jgi:4Fe-4S ferredoxin